MPFAGLQTMFSPSPEIKRLIKQYIEIKQLRN